MLPPTVDHLRALLHKEGGGVRSADFVQGYVRREHPLARDLLLLVDYLRVDDVRERVVVGFGAVRVQDHVASLQPPRPDWLPDGLLDRPRAWRALGGRPRGQLHDHQGLRAPALDDAE
eukprot:3044558-Alexandrium_andersonii.AAC.1